MMGSTSMSDRRLPKLRRRRSRAAGLPTVIMVVALMMLLAFTVVGVAFNHLNLTFRSSNSMRAQELSEAVLAIAIERVRLDVENFGIKGTADDKTIRLSLDKLPEGNIGVLTFDSNRAKALRVPVSTNNRTDSSVEGSNPRFGVPGQAVHLVARAEVGGAVSVMEALIEFPKFPYSIASKGPISSSGGLVVAAVRQGVDYSLGGPIDPSALEPGSLVSNSQGSGPAVTLAGDNMILGNLESASGADLSIGTKIFGETKLYTDPVPLPQLDATDYDPLNPASTHGAVDPDQVQMVNSGAGILSVKGYNVFGQKLSDGNYNPSATLTVDNGIRLKGGVLYVNGNLNVSSGGVSGKGAIIATGNITVHGDGEATTDNEAALVSNGNIVLSGASSEKAKFAGLVYSKGKLQATNMRLAGVFVAAGEDSSVEMADTELYQVAEKAKVEISEESTDFLVPLSKLTSTLTIPKVTVDGVTVAEAKTLPGATIEYDPTTLKQHLSDYLNPYSGPTEPKYLFKFKVGSVGYRHVLSATGAPIMVPTTADDKYLVGPGQLGTIKINGVAVSSESELRDALVAHFQAANEGKPLSASQLDYVNSLATMYFQGDQVVRNYSQAAAEESALVNTGEGQSAPFHWRLDLSEFFGGSKPMQITYWARFQP